MKKSICIMLSIVIAVALFSTIDITVNAKTKRLKKGIYYNSKKKIYMEVGSQWDEPNHVSFWIKSKERPGHLDEYYFKYKKGKLILDFSSKSRTKILIKSKKKFVWKGKKKEGTKFLNGTFKFKKKGNL